MQRLGTSPWAVPMQDFAGAGDSSAVNCPMMKRALVVIVGLLGFCFPLPAQQTPDAGSELTLYRPGIFRTLNSSVLLHSLPVLNLLDGQRLPVSSELVRLEIAPLNLFSNAPSRVAETQKVSAAPVYQTDGKDSGTDPKYSPAEMISSPLDRIYYGGEVGILYGHSTGKFGGDLLQTYMVGEVGNDKFHITVGTSYEESSGRLPRFRSVEPFNR